MTSAFEEYSYQFRDADNSTAYSALRSGPWMLEVKDHIESRIAGSPVKYRHNIAHDGSMAPLLGFLQIDQMVWPGTPICLQFLTSCLLTVHYSTYFTQVWDPSELAIHPSCVGSC